MKDNKDNDFVSSEIVRISQDAELNMLPAEVRIAELAVIASLIYSKLERTTAYGIN